MSTNATVSVYDELDKQLIKIYKHWDGDTFHETLVSFLSNIKVRNGVADYDAVFEQANGGSCLAAQLVKYIKETVGDVYIEPIDFRDERWHYNIKVVEAEKEFYDIILEQFYKGNVARIWKFNYRD